MHVLLHLHHLVLSRLCLAIMLHFRGCRLNKMILDRELVKMRIKKEGMHHSFIGTLHVTNVRWFGTWTFAH